MQLHGRLPEYVQQSAYGSCQNMVAVAINSSMPKASSFYRPPFVIPLLCDRRADILALVQYFMMKKAREMAGNHVGWEKGTAKLLKINPSPLRAKMRKLGIPFGRKGAV